MQFRDFFAPENGWRERISRRDNAVSLAYNGIIELARYRPRHLRLPHPPPHLLARSRVCVLARQTEIASSRGCIISCRRCYGDGAMYHWTDPPARGSVSRLPCDSRAGVRECVLISQPRDGPSFFSFRVLFQAEQTALSNGHLEGPRTEPDGPGQGCCPLRTVIESGTLVYHQRKTVLTCNRRGTRGKRALRFV